MKILYDHSMAYPSRIICLTEESVETLYLLGKEDLIVGVSEYVERPAQAKKLPVVSQFLRSDYKAIDELKPDLILGFSDIQKDIARDLIGKGHNVFITNQRSLQEILDYILLLGRIVGAESAATELVSGFRQKMQAVSLAGSRLPRKPKVYFEEWDHPQISAITWVSELIEVCGGENVFRDKAGSLATNRIVTHEEVLQRNPDIIIACWCGKKVNLAKIQARDGYHQLPAHQANFIVELPPSVFLQPGPALFVDGLGQMFSLLEEVAAGRPLTRTGEMPS